MQIVETLLLSLEKKNMMRVGNNINTQSLELECIDEIR
jgi:hypothetical protein